MTEPELERYRKNLKNEKHLNFLLSDEAVKFFNEHPDLVRGTFTRDAVDEKIARIRGMK